MIDTIYIEQAVARHPRTQRIVERFTDARTISCGHYGEIFNRGNQDFRVQKTRPALILAEKAGRRVLPIPAGNRLDGDGFYFSHMLNCLYDCRYCFLQGMMRSAHYLLFVNYEDFVNDIRSLFDDLGDQPTWLFSGYDCDSLALEPVTGFAAHFVPALATIPNLRLELRTKSTQIRSLLAMDAQRHVVCAFSISPPPVVEALEHRTPGLEARLDAAANLQRNGWQIALRLDPLILSNDFQADFDHLLDTVEARLDCNLLDSITLGVFRLPQSYASRMRRLYPDEALFATELTDDCGQLTYPRTSRESMLAWCRERLARRLGPIPVYEQGP